jgi:hypothetical protein
MSDPFYPVLVDCIFAAQGLIFAGNGALVSPVTGAIFELPSEDFGD